SLMDEYSYLAHASDSAFCIIVASNKLHDIGKVAEFAGRLCHDLNQVMLVEDLSLSITVNIGISIYCDDADNFMELTRKSSAALSYCDHSGDKSYKFFDTKMETVLSHRIQIESLLVDALSRSELSIHYQPFVDTQTQQVIGAEALLRWNNAELGCVSPTDFIAIAEQSGQIIEIGYFVLRSGIQQAAYWRQLYNPDFYIAINVSPLQLKDEILVDKIVQLLEMYQLPPSAIEIEITENALIQDAEQALLVLNKLADIGVRLSLDDFGTGYSSLSYLQNYPFSSVKIDRSFIDNLAESYKNRELVLTIISMAKNLNLSLVAEGVEDKYQAEFVAQSGADVWQGYYYGKPTDAGSFSKKHLISERINLGYPKL
ncbi:MAG: EAL domain-containing protein, partial [Gammaproteobacteria bacterium]|nr:EAL domain-containing protein [Gammaproteobacteria bacterium]